MRLPTKDICLQCRSAILSSVYVLKSKHSASISRIGFKKIPLVCNGACKTKAVDDENDSY